MTKSLGGFRVREIEVDENIYRVSTILSILVSMGLIVSGLFIIDIGLSGQQNIGIILGLILILVASMFYIFSSRFIHQAGGEEKNG